MKQVFKESLHRSCTKPIFFLAVLAVPLCILFSQIDLLVTLFREGQALESGFCWSFLLTGLKGDSLSFLLPLLCALPDTTGLLEDRQSGMVKFVLSRSRRRAYLWGRILGCICSGALLITAGILLAGLIFWCFFSPFSQPPAETVSASSLVAPVLEAVLRFAVSGALWAAIGMSLSTITGSRYVAYFSPFISYYLLVILYERYFPFLVMLYPKEWLNPEENWPLGEAGVILWMTELLFLLLLLFYHTAERRLRDV